MMAKKLTTMACALALATAATGAYSLAAGGAKSSPATAPATINVGTIAELNAALAVAATTPNTTIRFTADITSPRSRSVQGRGTVLDLNGHTFKYDEHFNGAAGTGWGLTVQPTLSAPGPINPAKPAILCNPPGGVTAIEKALGGQVFPPFVEPAPVQYADEKPLRDTYTLQRDIQIPADNITVMNGKIACIDAQALSGLYVLWARNVTLKDLTFIYLPNQIPQAGSWAQQCTNVVFDHCDFGAKVVSMNSAYNTTLKNCSNGIITFEERCQVATIQNCSIYAIRVNDVTCGNMKFIGNTIKNDLVKDYGAIGLYELGGDNLIQDNTLIDSKSEGSVWVGYLNGTLKLTGNKGSNFYNYRPDENKNKIVEEKNDWFRRAK